MAISDRKVSVVTGDHNIEAVVWRRDHRVMSDQDVDDVAFLTGGVVGTESPTGQPQKKSLYENNGVAACSHNRALCIATIVFALLFTIAIVIAFTGPQSDCTCAGEKPPNFVDEETNLTRTFIPRAANGEIFPWNNIRLPTTLKPSRYNLTIHPNLTTLEVRGQVSIEFHADKDTNFIVLHSNNLTIMDKMIQDRKGHNLTIVKVLEYSGARQLYIEIREKFKKKHNYTLRIRFNTKLNKNPEGFYLSSYINTDGEKRYLATTHFEPIFARSAFPCFDEPHFKAKFRLTIFRDRFHIALFNTPVVNTDDLGFYMGTGLLRDDFQETVEMSTYLVAFVVCDYDNVRNLTERGISVSVYTPPPYKEQAHFALNTATHILNFFEDFFGMPFPLPKLDLVAIPDLSTGAMENWGLVTYRETAILYDPEETSINAHQWITTVIAHELAHQWFGNLVTMKWWNDLWLNEGFASYLEYLGVDSYFPEWKMMDQFIIDKTQPALALDALSSSHPVNVPVDDPDKIEAIFDTISYSKGAAIIHMLSNFLQQETLQNGLNDYLQTFKYTNADTKDLWNVFTRNTNQTLDVKTVMDTWTNQMGFPLITLNRIGNEIVATQERFLLTVENMNSSIRSAPKSKYDYKWHVPLTYTSSNDTETVITVWMNMTEARFEIDPDIKWIKANVNQSGFYRVMYEEDMWHSLISLLKTNHHTFNAADRANLIDDAFTLCRAGLLNASIPLELSMYLVKERDYVPWATAIDHLQNWATRLSESLAYKLFLKYMRHLLKPIATYLGWKNSGSHLNKLIREDVLSAATLCELNETITQAKVMFQKWMSHNKSIDSNLKEVVYSAGIKYGGMAEWQHCWNVYNSTTSPSERTLLLKALGVASDPWLLQRYLMETLDKNTIKPQDVKVVLAVVAANPEGRLLAWRHLKAYWPTMHSIFGNATFMMGSLISAVTAHLSTPYDYYEVSTYFNGMNVGAASRALEQSLEIIKLNIHWVQQNEEDIFTWLRKSIK
ncbi:endoplasmic reticulum aminopeptidase 1-like isoform X3 [Cylas formicarius]|uniref:endoplasmic reticulum aminopeptidase 1-like isoform X3 n=1 Tax=Cylas formicarius TaxID=197179 RepID=UPI002958C7F1|nr:endoplasmic reticulum aminopeptidase 1-like isoform X3 [Cylas formicarius]